MAPVTKKEKKETSEIQVIEIKQWVRVPQMRSRKSLAAMMMQISTKAIMIFRSVGHG